MSDAVGVGTAEERWAQGHPEAEPARRRRLIAVMAVFEEEEMIASAVESLWRGGVDEVHAFDGAWEGFDGRDNLDRASHDETARIATDLGCVLHPARAWRGQEHKRTAMFQECGAREGDLIVVFDADEVLEGAFEPLEHRHHNMLVRAGGPNDLPGIRGDWPRGDYSPDYIPQVRVFAWDPELRCLWPGRYKDRAGHIRPYLNSSGASALPVVRGATFVHNPHLRPPERIAAKVAYYEREHPRRTELVQSAWRESRW